MLALIVFAAFGLFISIAIHLCTLLNLFRAPHVLVLAQNIGIGILLCAIALIAKKYRKGTNKREFNRILLNHSPNWMKTIIGLFIIYGIVVFVFSLGGAFSIASAKGDSGITIDKFHKGLSAFLMVFYAVEFSLLYCYRCLQKEA